MFETKTDVKLQKTKKVKIIFIQNTVKCKKNAKNMHCVTSKIGQKNEEYSENCTKLEI